MINAAFSMPLMWPPYGPPPYPVENAKLVIVQFETDPAAVAALVPKPLEPVNNGVVTAFVGDVWQSRGPGAYLEGGLVVPVTYKGRASSYVPILLTSTEDALYVGREVFGLPKLLCDDGQLSVIGNGRKGDLRRRGERILSLSVQLDDVVDGKHMLPQDRYMLKRIPSPDPQFPSLNHLVHQALSGHRVERSFKGRGHIILGGDLHVDLTGLQKKRVLEAWYIEASWNVPPAKVITEERLP